jgi:hypothetical protein
VRSPLSWELVRARPPSHRTRRYPPDARPKAASDALAALARRIRSRKEPATIANAHDVHFTAIAPSGPFGHLCIGPVNWSQIARITKTGHLEPDSFMFGDRERYAIEVVYED